MAQCILILAAGVGSGHNQAAAAIEAAVAHLPEVEKVDRIDILETTNDVFNRLYDDAYFTLVSEVPWLVGWGYDNQGQSFQLAPIVNWWEQLNTLASVRQICSPTPSAWPPGCSIDER